MEKKKVYLNEYNIPIDNAIYLPYSMGMLQAYAQKFPETRDNYEFMPIIFKRDNVDNIVAQYNNPSIAAFSVSMWNYNLSCVVAKRIKKLWPQCITIFGGPHVTKQISFMDHIIRGEGEKAFATILDNLIGIARIDYDFMGRDIDNYVSPYTNGVYNQIIKDNPDV